METTSGKVILPEKYYLDYFKYLIGFVEQNYDHVLGDPERSFISDFRALGESAQCLFVRFSNRKGPLYRLSKIQYIEIPDPESAADELLDTGFVTNEVPNAFESFNLFTRTELWKLFRDDLQSIKSSKKIQWIEFLLEDEQSYLRLKEVDRIVEVGRQKEVEFLKMLFFGAYKAQMTEFVIRDVGNVKLETLDESKFTPWCNSREEALAFFEASELKSLVRKAMQVFPAVEIHRTLTEVDWPSFQRHKHSAKALGKLVVEFGQQLEREGAREIALFYYELTNETPARERRVRLLDALEDTEGAASLAEEMLKTYNNASERIFAKDFLSRPNIRINRSMTTKLTNAPKVTLTQSENIRVEQQVIQHFETQGFKGIHSENFIWRNLFGLIFWNELFDQSQDSFHHPLQRVAGDLYTNFFQNRYDKLQTNLQRLKTRQAIIKKIESTRKEKYGIANPFVYWYEGVDTHLAQVLKFLKPGQVKSVLIEIAKNPRDNSKGFPDLFIWNETNYHFYEIKSPNDHLSAQQLFWIEFMQDLGIKAEVLRVDYDNNS